MVMAAAASAAQVIPGETAAQRELLKKLVAAAVERSHHPVRYDPAYVRIPYPGGDVPADTGVCTDEIIRAYRAVGIDLQREVHEDMVQNFSLYPRKWRWLSGHQDTNIDHRRVPNLMVFFSRKGEMRAITERPEDYAPGDLVTWDLRGNVPHIGIVVDHWARAEDRRRPVQLENYRPLPVFRAAAGGQNSSPQPAASSIKRILQSGEFRPIMFWASRRPASRPRRDKFRPPLRFGRL
jgi:hypothetical protein